MAMMAEAILRPTEQRLRSYLDRSELEQARLETENERLRREVARLKRELAESQQADRVEVLQSEIRRQRAHVRQLQRVIAELRAESAELRAESAESRPSPARAPGLTAPVAWQPAAGIVWAGEDMVRLSPFEAALMDALVRFGGRLAGHDALCRAVWPDRPVDFAAVHRLRVIVTRLRVKLARVGLDGHLATATRVGYVLNIPGLERSEQAA